MLLVVFGRALTKLKQNGVYFKYESIYIKLGKGISLI